MIYDDGERSMFMPKSIAKTYAAIFGGVVSTDSKFHERHPYLTVVLACVAAIPIGLTGGVLVEMFFQ